MTPDEFHTLAGQGHNRIPLMRQVLGDLDTPLSAYLKLADGPYSYLLESVQGDEKWGRYSIIGLPASTIIRVVGQRVERLVAGQLVEAVEVEDPLAWIESYQQKFKVAPLAGLPRFTGGLVGYFGYDIVRYVEPRLGKCPNPDPLQNPDILLMLSEEVVVFDNFSGSIHVIVHADTKQTDALQKAMTRLDELVIKIQQPLRKSPRAITTDLNVEASSAYSSSFTREEFEKTVDRIKEYIVDGDVMQVVPSQRMTVPFAEAPLDLYRALRLLNPSPYMFYLNLDDFHVVGASPEVLARLEDGELTVRPIAGTRPRGENREQDLLLERQLMEDPKELAEHLMLIDLGRNDVGRVCETGTVRVTEKMVVERYSHVMHIVSNVTGRLKPGLTALDALRATFPAGTLSGAPKIRAMEIIDEMEPVKRGVYSGAVGYLGWSGNMDTAIAIRTAVIKDGQLHVQAGGGIVADSVPALEWEETINKRRAVFRAVAMVQAGSEKESNAKSRKNGNEELDVG